jgi:dihydrofolate reductase
MRAAGRRGATNIRTMGRMTYSMMVSLDGYVETADHSIEWGHIDAELHRFVNEQARQHAAFVNGRRLYEVLRVWDTIREDEPDLADFMVEFADIWNQKPKIVVSSTLTEVGRNATLVRADDIGQELARLKRETDGELDVGGPMLAAAAIGLDLVDEFRLFVHQVTLGGGTPFFPRNQRMDLELVDEHRFRSGVVYLAYRPRSAAKN